MRAWLGAGDLLRTDPTIKIQKQRVKDDPNMIINQEKDDPKTGISINRKTNKDDDSWAINLLYYFLKISLRETIKQSERQNFWFWKNY